MASGDQQPEITVGNKRDVDDKRAEFFVRIHNLKKSRDKVTVVYPNNSCLVVRINGNDVMTRQLPAPVQIEKCKFEVKYKDNGYVLVKLRKLQPGRWMDRWSPRRELQQHVSNSNSLVVLPVPVLVESAPAVEECTL